MGRWTTDQFPDSNIVGLVFFLPPFPCYAVFCDLDPMTVINAHGADALRLYLINSPVVRAETLKFKEEGVQATVRDVLLPWFNAFRFFVQQV